MRRAILTFAGKVRVSASSEVWRNVATVMKQAGANIEAAGSTFLHMSPGTADPLSGSFTLSAFGAKISPSSVAERCHRGEDMLGCALCVKALLPEDRVQIMMDLLSAESPLQVYSVSIAPQEQLLNSQASGVQPTSAPSTATAPAVTRCTTGTLYLYGIDRPGQLSTITETLSRFGVVIMHLSVQKAIDVLEGADIPTASGGLLAENILKVAFHDAAIDEAELMREIRRVGVSVGYAVTCLTTDREYRLRARTPSYILQRKAFTLAYLNAMAREGAANRPLPGVGARAFDYWRRRALQVASSGDEGRTAALAAASRRAACRRDAGRPPRGRLRRSRAELPQDSAHPGHL